MKKTAFMVVYNDADYADYAIRSVKDRVDELLIIEGAFEITMRAGMPARSNDGIYPRIFKGIKGSRFVYDNEVHFAGFARGAHRAAVLESPRAFHYGYVRHKERFLMKLYHKDKNPAIKSDYSLEGDAYRIPAGIKIAAFAGGHPPIMHTHPFYRLNAHDIIYGR